MVSRRRFLFRSAAGVAIAMADPAEVVRRVWPGFSAARDGYVSVGFDVLDPGPARFAGWVGDTIGELKRPWTEMGYPRSGLEAVDTRLTAFTMRAGELLLPGDLVHLGADGYARRADALDGVLGQVMATDTSEGLVTVQTSGLVTLKAIQGGAGATVLDIASGVRFG